MADKAAPQQQQPMSATYIAKQKAFFAAVDDFELEEESSSSDESSSSSDDEPEPAERLHDSDAAAPELAAAEPAAAEPAELRLSPAEESDAEDDGADAEAAGSSLVTSVYGRGSAETRGSSSALFDEVLSADGHSSSLSAVHRGQKRRHTTSQESLSLDDIADDTCDLLLSPLSADQPSSPELTASSSEDDDASTTKKMRLELRGPPPPSFAARRPRVPKSNREALLKAIGKGNITAIEALLAKGVSTEFFTAEGATPLGHAITLVDLDRVVSVTELLLVKGADPNTTVSVDYEEDESERAGPLELSLARGLPELVQLLLKFGAQPQRVPRAREVTLMQYAAEGGFSAQAADTLRRSLRTAVAVSDALAVKALTAHGAECEDADVRGRSLLHRALSMEGRADAGCLAVIVALLEAGSDPNLADGLGVLPLCFPVLRTDLVLLSTLLAHGADANKMLDDDEAVGGVQSSVTVLEWARRNAIDKAVLPLLSNAAVGTGQQQVLVDTGNRL